MKKLLSILSAIGLTALSSSAVVACGTSTNSNSGNDNKPDNPGHDTKDVYSPDYFEPSDNSDTISISQIFSTDKQISLYGTGLSRQKTSFHRPTITWYDSNNKVNNEITSNLNNFVGITYPSEESNELNILFSDSSTLSRLSHGYIQIDIYSQVSSKDHSPKKHTFKQAFTYGKMTGFSHAIGDGKTSLSEDKTTIFINLSDQKELLNSNLSNIHVKSWTVQNGDYPNTFNPQEKPELPSESDSDYQNTKDYLDDISKGNVPSKTSYIQPEYKIISAVIGKNEILKVQLQSPIKFETPKKSNGENITGEYMQRISVFFDQYNGEEKSNDGSLTKNSYWTRISTIDVNPESYEQRIRKVNKAIIYNRELSSNNYTQGIALELNNSLKQPLDLKNVLLYTRISDSSAAIPSGYPSDYITFNSDYLKGKEVSNSTSKLSSTLDPVYDSKSSSEITKFMLYLDKDKTLSSADGVDSDANKITSVKGVYMFIPYYYTEIKDADGNILPPLSESPTTPGIYGQWVKVQISSNH